MKKLLQYFVLATVALLLIAGWILYFHNDRVTGILPPWHWLQASVKFFGQSVPPVVEEDEDPDNTKNEIPVHVAHISVETLHRYIEGVGIVAPSPPRNGRMAGRANIAAPVAGVVARINCQVGQKVKTGDPLITLDDRLAQSAETQSNAALAQAEASLAALQATPRPDQLAIAQLAVEKSQAALDFAKKNLDRVAKLASEEGATAKALEQARLDQSAAENDFAVATKQLAILKATPTREDLNQELAKVAQAKAAAAAAKTQRELLTITAPIDATVVSLSIDPGEAVDPTRTLISLIATDRLTVEVNVPAEDLPVDADKLSAEIRPSSKNAVDSEDPPVLGKVAAVSPQVNPQNGSVTVGIDLPADAPFRPGLSVRVRIIAGTHEKVFAVPRNAVVSDENGDSVIALIDKDQATHKSVKLGFEENGLIEIIADDLHQGDTVVTAGAFGLPQATRVKIIP